MQGLMITSLSKAYRMVKEMLTKEEWEDEDIRPLAKDALKEVLKQRMEDKITQHLSTVRDKGLNDRRNGYYIRHLITELGDIMITIPRTRTYAPNEIIKNYARRCKEVDRLILACFLLGLSTRKVAKALSTILKETISPQTVSNIAKTLDDAVFAFHRRKLKNIYKVLIFDGIVLSRKTGGGSIKRPVLVALGIRHDGKKEIIDFKVATSESEKEWEDFLTSLYKRGLSGEDVNLIVSDGGKGLLAALSTVYPGINIQRCWAHKARNILDKVKKKDQKKVKEGLIKIYNASNIIEARSCANKWVKKWEEIYPGAVKSLKNDLEDLLSFFMFKDASWRKMTRTTNAIERRFREVKRRTRPMGVFSNRTSMERILYAVFTYENEKEGVAHVFMV